MSTLGKIIPLLLLALLVPMPGHADRAALEQAEKLFQSGEWEKARQAYSAELAATPDTHLLPAGFFYNYGTVLAKAGAGSEAYVSLLRAAFAQPLDSDTRANLALAERSVPAGALAVKPALWFQWWPSSLRLVPWQAWFCLALAITAALLALPKGSARQEKLVFAGVAGLLLLAGGLAYLQASLPVSGLIGSAKVRSGPGNSFPEITALDAGSLVNVEARRDGWLKVRFVRGDSPEVVGWIEPSVALEVN